MPVAPLYRPKLADLSGSSTSLECAQKTNKGILSLEEGRLVESVQMHSPSSNLVVERMDSHRAAAGNAHRSLEPLRIHQTVLRVDMERAAAGNESCSVTHRWSPSWMFLMVEEMMKLMLMVLQEPRSSSHRALADWARSLGRSCTPFSTECSCYIVLADPRASEACI